MDRAEAWLGDLPETWRVTSRGWENRAAATCSGNRLTLTSPTPRSSQFSGTTAQYRRRDRSDLAHRFSWAPGDTHYKNGELIECFDPDGEICWLPYVDELPELPERWVRYLRNPPVAQIR